MGGTTCSSMPYIQRSLPADALPHFVRSPLARNAGRGYTLLQNKRLSVSAEPETISLARQRREYAPLVLILLVFCYPLFGIAFGHSLASLIMPGTFPCPTTALGLLLLTTALPQVDKVIYILLLICAIPFTPFVQIARYDVYEDTILFATGMYSLVLLLQGHHGWRR